jgi:hypothetical protein
MVVGDVEVIHALKVLGIAEIRDYLIVSATCHNPPVGRGAEEGRGEGRGKEMGKRERGKEKKRKVRMISMPRMKPKSCLKRETAKIVGYLVLVRIPCLNKTETR